MTPPNPLIELAERCEKLTRPCRETDALIAAALRIVPVGHPWLSRWTGEIRATGHCVQAFNDKGESSANWRPFTYTASLDAAMTLVPEGCYVDTQERYRIHRDLEYTDHSWARVESADGGKFLGSATAKTVPLAIVAAILRARAESEAIPHGR